MSHESSLPGKPRALIRCSLGCGLLLFAVSTASAVGIPAAPGNLAGDLEDRNILLSWTDTNDEEFGYRVYRAAGDGAFVLIAEIGADSTTFLDTGRPVGKDLNYRVTAFNELGESLAAVVAMDAIPEVSSGPDWVWIEAENFATTTFRGGGDSWFSPQPSEVDALSNGDNFSFQANQAEEAAGFVYNYNITYEVDIPADGEYLFYVRRAAKYGVFKWRIDDGEWNYVPGDAPVLGREPWREFFPLAWADGGSTTTTAGRRTLEIRANPSVDFPEATAAQMSHYMFDCFLLSQTPFKPAGKAKPGSKLARAKEGYWPFEPDVDPYHPSPIDLSYLNEDVAGQDGWITREGDAFILGNGSKVRFYGVNVGTGTFSTFSSQARHLAKKGVNIVRYTENIDDPDEDSNSILNVNEATIRQVQQLVAAYKQHGIYSTLSYFFILKHFVLPAWDIPGFDAEYTSDNRQPFGIFFWNEDFKNAYKVWVRELLTRPNPWDPDNTPLAEDPALAMLELLNEDNLFFYTFVPSRYPEIQRLALEKLFGDWLTGRFGSLEQAAAQWGGSLRSRDHLATGHIEVLSAGDLRPGGTGTALRGQIQAQWMAELQINFWTEMKAYIRSLGCEALIIPSNWKTAREKNLRDLEHYTYAAVDVIDTHNYLPQIGTSAVSYEVRIGDTYRNISAIDRPEQISTAYKQVEDRPNIISEFTWTNPNDMGSEGPLIAAAYAALQDVDGIIWFTYGSTIGYLDSINRRPVGTPDIMGQFPGTALLYRRGDVAEAPVAFREGRSLESLGRLEDSLIVQDTGFDPTRDTGFDPQTGEGILGMETALVGKVELSFGEDWDYLHPDFYDYADFNQGIFKSLTGQVELNQPNGIVRVDTPTAQGVTGFLGDYGEVAFDDCIIRMENPFGAVLVISLDGLPISRSGKVLIQAAAPDGTYGYEVEDAVFGGQPAFKILNLGTLPLSMQNIEGEVVLKGFAGAQPEVLDLNGYPVTVPVSFTEGGDLRLKLPFNSLYTVVTREVSDNSPVILSRVIPSIVVDKDYTEVLTASGGTGSYTWSVVSGSLPPGISLAPTGKLSGKTSATAAGPVTVRVTDGSGASAQAILPVNIIGFFTPSAQTAVLYDGTSTNVEFTNNATAVADAGVGNPAGSLKFTTTAAYGNTQFASTDSSFLLKPDDIDLSASSLVTFDYLIPNGSSKNVLADFRLKVLFPDLGIPGTALDLTAGTTLIADGTWHTASFSAAGWSGGFATRLGNGSIDGSVAQKFSVSIQAGDPGLDMHIDNIIIRKVSNSYPGWVDDAELGFIYMAAPEWGYSFYLGWIYLPNRPWVYANPVGWMYHAAGHVPSGLWWYSPQWGWIFVSSNNGGFFQYSQDGGITWEWNQFAL